MAAQPSRNTEWWGSVVDSGNALLGRDGAIRTPFADALCARDYYGYFSHFSPAGIYDTTTWPGWTVSVITATSTGTLVEASGVGGWLALTSGTHDGAGIQAQQNNLSYLPAAGKHIWFEAEIKIADADDMDWMVGLASTDTNVFSTDPTELIVFRGDDGDLNIDFQVRNGGTGAAADTTYDTANGTAVRLGFFVNGVTSVTPYINGTALTAVTSNLPTAVTRVTLGALGGASTGSNTCSVNWLRIVQLV